MNQQIKTEVEVAAFRYLLEHLSERNNVQNIDLMNLAGFCRNCFSKWYRTEAEKRNTKINYEQAREVIYDMH